jgi:hypothetical protein
MAVCTVGIPLSTLLVMAVSLFTATVTAAHIAAGLGSLLAGFLPGSLPIQSGTGTVVGTLGSVLHPFPAVRLSSFSCACLIGTRSACGCTDWLSGGLPLTLDFLSLATGSTLATGSSGSVLTQLQLALAPSLLNSSFILHSQAAMQAGSAGMGSVPYDVAAMMISS